MSVATVTRFPRGLPWLILCLVSHHVSAQKPIWHAEDAIRHALVLLAIDSHLDAEIERTEADTSSLTLRPNPKLEVTREALDGTVSGDTTELSVVARQAFDISPWRQKLREAQSHRVTALNHKAQARKTEVAAEVRSAFFRVRYRQDRQRELKAWLVRLEDGVHLMVQRERQGDVSLLAVRRMERERDLAMAEVAKEASRMAEAWLELRSLAPWQIRPELRGNLNPKREMPQATGSLPQIEHLTALDRSLETANGAWGSPFLRNWEVGAGYRSDEEAGERSSGYLLSLAIPLTFWNQDRPRQRQIRARQAQVKADLRTTQTRAEQTERAARERLQRVFEAQDRLPPASKDGDLITLAAAAFEAGEEPLSELLAAYRGDLDLKIARLELAWEARRAKIELEHRIGLGVPQ